jgi:hypothetical protein
VAKIITIKLEIPADDDASVTEVKSKVAECLRTLGTYTALPAEGQTTIMDRSVFYGATTVKFWVTPGERKKTPKVTA